MTEAPFVLQRILTALPRYNFRAGDEKQFHESIATVLVEHGVAFQREYIASPQERFDFLCEGGAVLEAKINGSLSDALRQADRYCQLEVVSSVVIVSTKRWGDLPAGFTLFRKPVHLVVVARPWI